MTFLFFLYNLAGVVSVLLDFGAPVSRLTHTLILNFIGFCSSLSGPLFPHRLDFSMATWGRSVLLYKIFLVRTGEVVFTDAHSFMREDLSVTSCVKVGVDGSTHP